MWNRDWRASRWIAPAPLPPLALAVVSPISRLPFYVAMRLWRVLLLAALLLSALCISRIVSAPLLLPIAALIPIGLIENGFNGQPVALVLLLITAAALALKHAQYGAASLLAACTFAEPHLALPVCAAMFVWQKRCRPWLIGITSAFIAVSLFALPWELTKEYIVSVLPHHAAAEANWYQQYSLTYVLTFFGLRQDNALAFGALWYGFACSFGIVLSRYVARRTGRIEALVLIPVALAVFGGSFLHIFQLIVAIPAAVMLGDTTDELTSWAATSGLFMVSLPWMKIWIPGMLVICVLLLITVLWTTQARRLWVAFGLCAVFLMSFGYRNVFPVAHAPKAAVHFASDASIEEPYAKYVAAARPSADVSNGMFLAKIPTWAGLILVILAAVAAPRRRRCVAEGRAICSIVVHP